MIVRADEIIDWIADRRAGLTVAWSEDFASALDWDIHDIERLVGSFHDHMVEAMLEGSGEAGFLKSVGRTSAGMDRRLEDRLARRFHAGTYKLARYETKASPMISVFPVLRAASADVCRCQGHRAFDGVVLRQDNEFWSRWRPPFSMECTCGVIAMTRGQFERAALTLTTADDLKEREQQLSDRWSPAFEALRK